MRSALAALALPSPLACAPFRHGPPPPRPDPADARGRCVFEQALVLSPGSASGRLASQVNASFGHGATPWYTSFRVDGVSERSTSDAGFTVYRGELRLKPREALLALDSPELVAAHDADLERFASGRHVAWSRPLWIGLLGGGLGLLFAGSATVLGASRDPQTGVTDYGPTLPLLGGSVLAMLASLPFVALDFLNQEEAHALTFRGELLIPPGDQAEPLRAALARQHAQVEASCREERAPR